MFKLLFNKKNGGAFRRIALVGLIVTLLSGCSTVIVDDGAEKLYYDSIKSSNDIGGIKAVTYVERCKELIKSVYAPESRDEFNSIRDNYSDIVTESCLKQLCTVSSKLVDSDFNNTVEFNSVRYGYPSHTEDERKRIYMNIYVKKDSLTWRLNVELSINDESNKVYDVDVW